MYNTRYIYNTGADKPDLYSVDTINYVYGCTTKYTPAVSPYNLLTTLSFLF